MAGPGAAQAAASEARRRPCPAPNLYSTIETVQYLNRHRGARRAAAGRSSCSSHTLSLMYGRKRPETLTDRVARR